MERDQLRNLGAFYQAEKTEEDITEGSCSEVRRELGFIEEIRANGRDITSIPYKTGDRS